MRNKYIIQVQKDFRKVMTLPRRPDGLRSTSLKKKMSFACCCFCNAATHLSPLAASAFTLRSLSTASCIILASSAFAASFLRFASINSSRSRFACFTAAMAAATRTSASSISFLSSDSSFGPMTMSFTEPTMPPATRWMLSIASNAARPIAPRPASCFLAALASAAALTSLSYATLATIASSLAAASASSAELRARSAVTMLRLEGTSKAVTEPSATVSFSTAYLL